LASLNAPAIQRYVTPAASEAIEPDIQLPLQRARQAPPSRGQNSKQLQLRFLERLHIVGATKGVDNVDTWLHHEPELRMVRTLDGQARAFLSDRYRRLDNYDLREHVLPMLQRLPDARFESTELTPTRLYLKVVTPRVQIEIQPGDIVQAGVVISNSEVGQGTLSVQPLVYRLICRNGLIAADRRCARRTWAA
jgi:hypothetical protein